MNILSWNLVVLLSIDCVGILKLRNADVEQRIGIAKAKKKSTKARMVFRVTFQKPCGSPQVLQVSSAPILCSKYRNHGQMCQYIEGFNPFPNDTFWTLPNQKSLQTTILNW